MSNQSATAPEKMRANVKLAPSMLLCLSAARHRSELLAKAIIADNVSVKVRVLVTAQTCNSYFGHGAQSEVAALLPSLFGKTTPLLDLFPESAAIRNVWKHKLALVKGERAGSIVAAER